MIGTFKLDTQSYLNLATIFNKHVVEAGLQLR